MIVDVERVGHLGVCIAHADDGRAVLVRHTLPGERVRVVVTEERSGYLRADAVEVLRPSPHRVERRCPWSGPGRCGGCDWQHVSLEEQRRLKATVVAEQLSHLGGVPAEVLAGFTVETVPGDHDGLAWRTRVRLAVDRRGVAGLRRHRSRSIERIGDCPIADPALDVPAAVARRWRPGSEVELPPGPTVHRAAGRDWQVPEGGFWQVHPGAADRFVAVVDELLAPAVGERLVDLYAGVGLFAGALVARRSLGESVAVEGVEVAAEAAVANLAGLPVEVVTADVDEWVAAGGPATARPDLVVLDPPRRGAGPDVVAGIVVAAPRAVAYVACDPSALGRDCAHFRAAGWQLTAVRGLDAFPMTAHVETIARFEPGPR